MATIMSVSINKEQAIAGVGLTRQFLARVNLTGAEVEAFLAVANFLTAIEQAVGASDPLPKAPPADKGKVPAKPKVG